MRFLILLLLLARTAAADPSNSTLFYVGLGMAPPTYLAGVSLHEGSHAIAAKLVGADVEELHLFPPGIDPHVHKFRFGWTYVRGLRTRGDHAFFYIAPKITDTILLGGFTAVLFAAWPHNRYGQLALTVGATGLWVDFAKDVVVTSPQDDMVRVLHMWCIDGIATRLAYAAIDVGLGLIVAKGYERTFTRDMPVTMMVPLLRSAF